MRIRQAKRQLTLIDAYAVADSLTLLLAQPQPSSMNYYRDVEAYAVIVSAFQVVARSLKTGQDHADMRFSVLALGALRGMAGLGRVPGLDQNNEQHAIILDAADLLTDTYHARIQAGIL